MYVDKEGKSSIMGKTWLTVQFTNIVKAVLSHSRAGTCRRTVASEEQWCAVEQCLERARVGQCAEIGFGVCHLIVIECTAKLQLVPTALGFIYTAMYGKGQDHVFIASRAKAKVASMRGPCSFGHTPSSDRSQGTIYWLQHHVVSFWPGTPWRCCPLQRAIEPRAVAK